MKLWPDVLGSIRDFRNLWKMKLRSTELPPYSEPPVNPNTIRIKDAPLRGNHHPYTINYDPENPPLILQLKDGQIVGKDERCFVNWEAVRYHMLERGEFVPNWFPGS